MPQSSNPPFLCGASLPNGLKLGPYLIEKTLGAGGFGITYLAINTQNDRKVVIKENFPFSLVTRSAGDLCVKVTDAKNIRQYEWSISSFIHEARILSTLKHPGIVRALNMFKAMGTVYFVMDFAEGTALDSLMDKRTAANQPWTEQEILTLLIPCLDALEYIHQRYVYHRDIKPANILVTAEGHPILIDFGAARNFADNLSHTVIESHGYSPPEQGFKRGKHGPWSDLYSLAATVHKMIVGRPPSGSKQRILKDPFPKLLEREELWGVYSRPLLLSLDKALEPAVEQRTQTAREWKERLAVLTA